MRLYGKNSVIERLRVNPKSIRKIFLEEGNADTAYFRKKAQQWGIPIIPVTNSKMTKLARNVNTQGILVEVDDAIYKPFEEVLEEAIEKKRSLIFLDSLTDPQNLGAVIRSLACLGRFALIIPTHDAAGITETVLRVACGGDNYVSISRVANLGKAIDQAKEANFWILGAVVNGGQSLFETRLQFPLGLVIGSEQKGIKDVIRKRLDVEVVIPMSQQGLSLNVASAASIFCYEIMRQRKIGRASC